MQKRESLLFCFVSCMVLEGLTFICGTRFDRAYVKTGLQYELDFVQRCMVVEQDAWRDQADIGTKTPFDTPQASSWQHRRLLWKWRQNTKKGQRAFVNVVVVAPSVASWHDRRTRLREQFPRNLQLVSSNQTAILKFAIGTTHLKDGDIQLEHEHFSDLLFFDCLDTDGELNYQPNWNINAGQSSTTCKVLKSVQWAVQHYHFDFFFRLGDDSYLRIDKFLSMLAQNQLPKGKAVIGQILKTWIMGTEQEYPQGMGYGLTPEVCQFIDTAAPYLLDTAPEDGVVARWLFAIGTTFVHSEGWRAIDNGEVCDEDMILGHKLPTDLWSNITEQGLVDC